MTPQLEILITVVIVSSACAALGVFLILRKMAMMTDAISHTILLGIVIAFFITKSLTSPFLIIGAACMGVFTVYLTEMLKRTRLMAEDSAIGIVFPFLFSIAIILITKYAGNTHLDVDSVLLGELVFVPFDRLVVFGRDIGAKSLYVMGTILIIDMLFVAVFYKELKLATFDAALASVLGFSPIFIHYALMGLVSITAVGAFESVGSILVIAFMIGPPVTAYMLTDQLRKMLILSILIGIVNAIIGYWISVILDVSIAGSIATIIGITYLFSFIFAPKRGILAMIHLRRVQQIEYAVKSLLFHLYNHEGTDIEKEESNRHSIYKHLHWDKRFLERVLKKAARRDYLSVNEECLELTPEGRKYAIKSYEVL